MSTELEEVPMRIVVALDVHRRQITYKTLNRESGEVWRGRIAPATRGAVREWLEQFAGCEAEFALEGTTGWKVVIEQRTAWQQRLQAQLFHQGVAAGLKPRTRAGREALAQAELSLAGRELVALALRMLETIDRELAPLERALRAFARRQPGCRALIANLYGVGPISATAILAELGDCRRFTSSDDAVRHSGLDVTVHQSDSKRAAGHLSHEGPELLRWALFEAAHQSARRGSPDHDYYLQVAGRIDHNRACLSVARKLCRRAHHILRELGDQALAPVEPEPQAEEAIQAAA